MWRLPVRYNREEQELIGMTDTNDSLSPAADPRPPRDLGNGLVLRWSTPPPSSPALASNPSVSASLEGSVKPSQDLLARRHFS